jgi:uncharacterized protein YlxW (UPF0749 family)
MFTPVKNNAFNLKAWAAAYADSQTGLLEVLHDLQAQQAQQQSQLDKALSKRDRHHVARLRQSMGQCQQQINKLRESYNAGNHLLESMAISLGLENKALENLLALAKHDADCNRFMKDYWHRQTRALQACIK